MLAIHLSKCNPVVNQRFYYWGTKGTYKSVPKTSLFNGTREFILPLPKNSVKEAFAQIFQQGKFIIFFIYIY